MSKPNWTTQQSQQFYHQLDSWADELGFQQVGISNTELSQHEERLQNWLKKGYHGSMDYMHRHGTKRSRPQELLPNTISIISLRYDYITNAAHPQAILSQNDKGYISRYALGRDYHKIMRKKLATLGQKIEAYIGPYQYRVFVDSAPVLERAIAENAGLGWIGKNTMLLNPQAGSLFFLGEIYTDLPLDESVTHPVDNQCGECRSCIELCPTQAIVAPYQLDARRCISYLTIESGDDIPLELRPLLGNRIYGCDDCQLVCPWNRFGQISQDEGLLPRHQLDATTLLSLWSWTESEFLKRLEGSPIRRIGYTRWKRNLAVALGNSDGKIETLDALQAQLGQHGDQVDRHVLWAISQLENGNQPKEKAINRRQQKTIRTSGKIISWLALDSRLD